MTQRFLRRFAGLLGVYLIAVSAAAVSADDSAGNDLALKRAAKGESLTLNLKDADIKTLIATVSEVTGRNFVVDPRVKGDVTVLSNQPMSPQQLYETFLSVLDVHGFAAVPSGEVTKIIPEIKAKQNGSFGRGTSSTTRENIITRVLHVKNVPAAQLVPILRPLVPQYGHLAAYSEANTLIISDHKANVRRLAEIVARIDRNGVQDTEAIRLKYANAKDIADKLKSLKSANQGKGGPATFSVVADERTNSLIVTGDKQQRLRVRAIVADLDTKTQVSGGTQVIYLDYAKAEDIAPVLQNFLAGRSSSASTTNSGNSNSSGGASSSGGGQTRAASARRVAAGGGGGGSTNGSSVIAETGANALVVTAPADKMRELRHIIKKLDIRRGQVLLEAIIAEVTLSRSRQLGVNVAAFQNGGPAAASILNSQTLQAIPSLAMNGTPLGLIQRGLNIALGDTSGSNGFALLVNALSSNTNTNVLSTPSLITRDNEEAKIEVGQEVPFVSGNFTSGVSNGGGVGNGGVVNPFQTIQRKDVGLSLGFTPQISAGKTVQLKIDQEISSIAQNSGTTGAVDLITNKRTLTTSVEVDSGQILVLGGLIKDNVQQSKSKVPVLGDIPILGALFTRTNVQKQKRNLLNFIRPTILRGHGKANYYTRQKYDYIRKLQTRQKGTGISVMGETQDPRLPPIQKYESTGEAQHGTRGQRSSPRPGQSRRETYGPAERERGGGPSTDERAGGKRRGDNYGDYGRH